MTHVQICPKVYRGVEGWLITGRRASGWPSARVFTTTRTSAERIREAPKRDEQITMKHFQP